MGVQINMVCLADTSSAFDAADTRALAAQQRGGERADTPRGSARQGGRSDSGDAGAPLKQTPFTAELQGG